LRNSPRTAYADWGARIHAARQKRERDPGPRAATRELSFLLSLAAQIRVRQSAYAVRGPFLIEQPVADDAEERLKSVFQTDLLALFVGAPRVADRDFVDPPGWVAMPGDLGGHLRLKAEAVRFELQVGQHLAAEDLVAGLHVREIEVGEHVRQRGQGLVGHVVPEIQHAMALADESRAINDVGPPLQDRLEQPRIFRRVIIQIGVLHQDALAGGVAEALPQRRALALVALLEEDADVAAFQLAQDAVRAVLAAIIDQDQFLRDRHRLHAPNYFANPALLVVDRD